MTALSEEKPRLDVKIYNESTALFVSTSRKSCPPSKSLNRQPWNRQPWNRRLKTYDFLMKATWRRVFDHWRMTSMPSAMTTSRFGLLIPFEITSQVG